MSVSGGGALDVDVRTVVISGVVTINGAAPAGNVTLVFSGSAGSASVSTTGGTYSVALAPGVYSVGFAPGNACSASAPCVSAPIKSGVMLTQTGALDLDVPGINVTGNVSVNGAPISGGALAFSLHGGGSVTTKSFSATAASYSLALVPGTYDVSFVSDGSGNAPRNGGVVKSSVALSAGGALDIDLTSVTITGNVTAGGAPINSGSLTFDLHGGGSAKTSAFAANASSYSLTLLAGSYDVAFAPGSCTDGKTPCNGGVVKTGVALTQSGALDLDVPLVTVSGKATLNGAPITGGSLSFTLAGGKGATTSSFSSTVSSYSLALLPGTYDVGFVAGGCGGGLPCNSGGVKAGVALTQSGALDVDVPAVTVSGNVTLNGAPLTSGVLGFALRGGGSASSAGSSKPSSYSLVLLPGTYDVSYDNSGCGGGTPCNSGIVKAGVALTVGGALDVDVPAVTVSGMMTLDGAAWPASDAGGLTFSPARGSSNGAAFVAASGSYSVVVLLGNYVVSYTNSGCSGANGPPCDNEILLGCP